MLGTNQEEREMSTNQKDKPKGMTKATHKESNEEPPADTTLQTKCTNQEDGRQKNKEPGSVAGSPSVQPQKEDDEETGQSESRSEETYSYSEEDSPTTLSEEATGPKELQTEDL